MGLLEEGKGERKIVERWNHLEPLEVPHEPPPGGRGHRGADRPGGGCAGLTILIPDFPFIRTRHCRLSNGDARVKMSGAKIVRIESLNIRSSKINH